MTEGMIQFCQYLPFKAPAVVVLANQQAGDILLNTVNAVAHHISSARQLQFHRRTPQSRSGQNCRYFSFLFDEGGVGMLRGRGVCGGVLLLERACGPSLPLSNIITHSLSATRPSPLLPPTFPFHPRPTFLVGGGGGCRCTGAELGVRSTI